MPPSSPILRSRISNVLGKHTLHVQQVIEGMEARGWAYRRDTINFELGMGARDGVFVREAHGWYRNQLPGLPTKSTHPTRLRQGQLARAVWDALGNDALRAAQVRERLLAVGDLHERQCAIVAIGICLSAHCERGFDCFARARRGMYERIKGKRPRVQKARAVKEKR